MKTQRIKKTILILSILLGITLLAFAGVVVYRYVQNQQTVQEVLKDNYINKDRVEDEQGLMIRDQKTLSALLGNCVYADEVSSDGRTTLALYKGQSEINTAFKEVDLFPGDERTKNYQLSVSWKDNLNICFRASLDVTSEALADVMKIRIEMPDYGIVMYDGIMRDMPPSVTIPLSGENRTQTEILNYKITVYLDTGVGNECQDTGLIAHFSWWAENQENLAPNTGLDSVIKILWPILLATAALIFIFVLKKQRRNEDDAIQ